MSPGECRIDCLSGECCYLPLTSATLGCTPTCKATQPSAFPRGRCRAWVFDFVAVPFNCNYAASQIWETRLKNSCSKNTISFFHRKFFRPPLRVKYKVTSFWIKRLRGKLFYLDPRRPYHAPKVHLAGWDPVMGERGGSCSRRGLTALPCPSRIVVRMCGGSVHRSIPS